MDDSDASFHAPFCRTYTSVTMNGFVTSLPPTTASSRILLSTIAVEPMIREDRVRDDLASGALVEVLAEFCAPFPGYYLYYPQRRHASPALRALVGYLRDTRRR